MSVRVLTCYVLDCDDCGKQIESVEYEGGTSEPHYSSGETCRARLVGDPDDEDTDSLAFLDGQHIDGRDICGACNVKRICAERGHRWSYWLGPNDGTEWRYCERVHCQETEKRTAEATS